MKERHQILETAIPVTQKQHHPYQIKYSYHSTSQVIGHMENLPKRKTDGERDRETSVRPLQYLLCCVSMYTQIHHSCTMWRSDANLQTQWFEFYHIRWYFGDIKRLKRGLKCSQKHKVTFEVDGMQRQFGHQRIRPVCVCASSLTDVELFIHNSAWLRSKTN